MSASATLRLLATAALLLAACGGDPNPTEPTDGDASADTGGGSGDAGGSDTDDDASDAGGTDADRDTTDTTDTTDAGDTADAADTADTTDDADDADAADTTDDADAADTADTTDTTDTTDTGADTDTDTGSDTGVPCDDRDDDTVCDALDRCDGGDDRVDTDDDTVPDACDACPLGDDRLDADDDGVADACDVCSGGADGDDGDGDHVPDACDACPLGDDRLDGDTDTVPDACDICLLGSDFINTDADTVPDACDTCDGGSDTVDTDADTVPDACDTCPGGDDRLDADADGTPNACDTCDATRDDDADGVGDDCDACPGGDDARDDDADTVANFCDLCPGADDRPNGDGDALPDCADLCPDSPIKTEPGACGCETADTDTDGDLTADCVDACPANPTKIEPGICGCDTADVDTDTDGTADCVDPCPDDPEKVDAGFCGCGVADVDSDLDGTPDCRDACPDDPFVVTATQEVCNGRDDDCDGVIDDNIPSDGAGCIDPGPPSVSTQIRWLQFVVRSGNTLGPINDAGHRSGGSDAELALRVGTGFARTGVNNLFWDDLMPRSVDTFTFDAVSFAPSAATTYAVGYAGSTPWTLDCVQVNLNGTAWCNDVSVTFPAGTTSEASWGAINPSTCDTCWPSRLTHGPVISRPSETAVRIWGRTDSMRRVALRMTASSEDVTTSTPIAYRYPLAGDDHTFTIEVQGLVVGTTYSYQLEIDDEERSEVYTYEHTNPTAHEVVIASCAKTVVDRDPQQPAFEAMAARDPDYALLIGDNVYFDPMGGLDYADPGAARPSIDTMRQAYRDGIQRAFPWALTDPTVWADFDRDARADFVATTPIYTIWDDHDFLGNNTAGVYAGLPPDGYRDQAQRVFAEYNPNPAMGGDAGGIYYTFERPGVQYFMLDGRYFRELGGDTLLGSEQLAWLQEELRASTATFKVLVSGSGFTLEGSDDTFAAYPAELQSLLGFIADNDIEGVFLVSGDVHRSEFRYLPGAPNGYRLPMLVSSAIANEGSDCPDSNQLIGADGHACYGVAGEVNPSFIGITFNGNLATANMYDDRGTVLHTLTIRAGELVPSTPAPLDDRSPDVNGDGFGDLIVGAPDALVGSEAAGIVSVLYGSNACFQGAGADHIAQAMIAGASEAGDDFGGVLTWGDFENDGYDDIVVGVPDEAVGSAALAGAVTVIRGGPNGAGSHGGYTWSQDTENITGASEAGDTFGAAVAVGDFNCDDYDDLAIGAPGENSDAGFVWVIYGSAAGLDPVGAIPIQEWSQTGLNRPSTTQANERFGAALAAGDLDGDGADDLVVGAPGETVGGAAGAGAVFDIYGNCGAGGGLRAGAATATGAQGTAITRALDNVPGAAGANHAFGAALAIGQVVGTSAHEDLIIGAPGVAGASTEYTGAIFVGAGAGVGVGSATFQQLHVEETGGAITSPARVGRNIAVGDFNGDAIDDFAVGSDVGDGVDQFLGGFAAVFFGTSTAELSTAIGYFEQDYSRHPIADEPEDRTGASVAASDCDGDGIAELIVGSPGEVIGGDADRGLVSVVDPSGASPGYFNNQYWYLNMDALPWPTADPGDEFGLGLAR